MLLWGGFASAGSPAAAMMARVEVSSYPATATAWSCMRCTGSGGVLNLPVGGAADVQLEIINDASGAVTVTPASGQTITGMATFALLPREASARVRWCGNDWQLI